MSYKYKKVKLPDGTTRDEHRLIVEEYLGYKLDRDIVVHHLDGDKSNNDIENLDICLLSEHVKHHITDEQINRIVTATRNPNKGSKSNLAKLKEEDIPIIRERLRNGETTRDIASDYNVHYTAISKINVGKNWSHIP